MNFIFRTDLHVADKGPESWKGDYVEEVFSIISQVGELAKQHQAIAVLDGGDFIHVKAPSRNSHGLIARVAEVHQQYPCPTWSIEGNHDITNNRLDSLSRQPLGVLYATNVFKHLRNQVFEQNGVRVRVVGFPFSPTRSLKDFLECQKQEGDDYLIAVVHALAGKNPPSHVEDFMGEPVFRYEEMATPNGPDVFLFGHWHTDQGIDQVGGKWFVNQGACSRGALVRENLTRQPKAALIQADKSGIKVTSQPLTVIPAEDAFDLERKTRFDEESAAINSFAQELLAQVEAEPSDDVFGVVRKLNFATEVTHIALDYLEAARG